MRERLTDKTGFPLLSVPGLGQIHAWPVTKVQFERFIAETGCAGDQAYEQMLEKNPRMSYRHVDPCYYERLFVTGVSYSDALDFARWLGRDFDLPTVGEWRNLYGRLGSLSLAQFKVPASSPAAAALCVAMQQRAQEAGHAAALQGRRSNEALVFTLFECGLLEWVRTDGRYALLGVPRHEFHPNVYHPLRHVVQPFEGRYPYAGFRLVRRG